MIIGDVIQEPQARAFDPRPLTDDVVPAASRKAGKTKGINHRVPVQGEGFTGVFLIKAETPRAAVVAIDELVRRLSALKVVYE